VLTHNLAQLVWLIIVGLVTDHAGAMKPPDVYLLCLMGGVHQELVFATASETMVIVAAWAQLE
jgi:hypothetical protein